MLFPECDALDLSVVFQDFHRKKKKIFFFLEDIPSFHIKMSNSLISFLSNVNLTFHSSLHFLLFSRLYLKIGILKRWQEKIFFIVSVAVSQGKTLVRKVLRTRGLKCSRLVQDNLQLQMITGMLWVSQSIACFKEQNSRSWIRSLSFVFLLSLPYPKPWINPCLSRV